MSERSPATRSALVLLLLALALAASGALLVDYVGGSPVFCAEGGGCDALRQTAIGQPFGVPLPILGVGAFVVLGMLALSSGRRVRRANLVLSVLGGIIGLGLLLVQVLLGHLCPYCVTVDVSSILLAILAVDRFRLELDPPSGPVVSFLASSALAAALVAPFAWGHHVATKLPPVIAAELASTPPGKVTVVDFVDFECPHCRKMQEQLAPLVAAEGDKIHLVRKLVPLTRIHPHALAAARAACCADALGKGEAMADALFQTKIDDLTPEGCAQVAASLGLPKDKYDACLASPETDARLARDRHEFDEAARKGDGLPLLWVGTHKLMGAQDDGTLARVLGEAMGHAGS